MPRYRLTIEYDGRPFCGWQRQAAGVSVQAVLEAAIERITGSFATLHGAGRTDAGVHALAQVAHVDLEREWAPERLTAAMNAHLREHPVAVLEAQPVSGTFHARFSAHRRRYAYHILNRPAPPGLERGRCWHVPVHLEAEHMHEAGQRLIGRHDFTSFRSSTCQASSPLRTLERLHVARVGDRLVIRLAARSFLHHQVRNIVGSLRRVGEGRAPVDHLERVLEARDRAAAGQTAPAAGLFLEGIDYPP
jgi:tRNA pseudouridine38-40 synthase